MLPPSSKATPTRGGGQYACMCMDDVILALHVTAFHVTVPQPDRNLRPTTAQGVRLARVRLGLRRVKSSHVPCQVGAPSRAWEWGVRGMVSGVTCHAGAPSRVWVLPVSRMVAARNFFVLGGGVMLSICLLLVTPIACQ